jgi:hypothetical protein
MTDKFEQQLDEIRIAIYEETKDMSPEEFVNAINESGRKVAEEFGFTIVKSDTRQPAPKASGE